jgi:iron complex transport system permease protein
MNSRVLRLSPRHSIRYGTRSVIVVAVLLALAALIWGVTMFTGTYRIGAGQVLDVLAGGGTATDRFIIVDQRLPRVTAALLVGAALGASGALFQSLSRNPLGSPDLIGFTTGSATGALVIILSAGGTSLGIGAGTLLGGLATAVLVYLFAASRGVTGNRLILVGIAIGAMLASVNDYLITRADLESAESAKAWLYGSLNIVTWPQVTPLAVALVPLIPLALTIARPLRIMEMGDDTAAGLGVDIGRTRRRALLIGITLTGAAIMVAGPIGFLALAAPQLARRLTRAAGLTVIPTAVLGAVLLATADLAAQRVLAPFQIPVGLVTGALGGAYLLAHLATTGRATLR